MYLIVNNTDGAITKHEGNYPMQYIDSLLDDDNDFIVISLYSHTIKVPCGFDILNSIKQYNWKEYKIPMQVISHYYLLYKNKKR
jgi:hypothetical protein